MCLPGVKPEKKKVTLSLRTLLTLPGLVATERLADRTRIIWVVWDPSGFVAVAVSFVVLTPGPDVRSRGAERLVKITSPAASAVASASEAPAVKCTVVPGIHPEPGIVIDNPDSAWPEQALV